MGSCSHEGLSAAFLDDDSVLVEDTALPGDDTAPTVGVGSECLDPGDGMNGVTEGDRMEEFPLENGEERDRIHTWCLADQTGGD